MTNDRISKSEKNLKGYLVVVAAFAIMATFGGTRLAFGVFFKPLINDLGWTRAVTSGAYSLSYITHGLAGLLIGKTINRIGPRIIISIEALFMGIGYILMSQTSEIWQLYIFYSILIGIGNCVHVPIMSTISKQFSEKRGLITGIVMAGVGAGQIIVPPIVNWMISIYDWRMSYIITGIGALLLMMIAAQFLKYRSTKDMAGSIIEKGNLHGLGFASKLDDLSVRTAMCRMQFWLIVVIQFFLAYCTMSVTVHIVPYITDLNITSTIAASVLSVIGGSIIIGRITMGNAADKIGEESVFLIAFVLLLIVSVGILFFREIWTFYVFAIMFGFAMSTSSVTGSTLIARVYGLKLHAIILSMATLGFTIGAAISPYIFGYIHDITNSYYYAFLSCVVMAGCGLFSSILLLGYKSR